jgi:hypothetical protein
MISKREILIFLKEPLPRTAVQAVSTNSLIAGDKLPKNTGEEFPLSGI